MIVLDDNLDAREVYEPLRSLLKGRLVYLRKLRPGTIIKDEAVPVLLRREKQATFVTTNVTDFWRRMPADHHFCIVCMRLPNERQKDIPDLLRRLLGLPEFATKMERAGKVALVAEDGVEWYEAGALFVQSRLW